MDGVELVALNMFVQLLARDTYTSNADQNGNDILALHEHRLYDLLAKNMKMKPMTES